MRSPRKNQSTRISFAAENERLHCQLVKKNAALQKIADLIDAETGEPLDDAIAIARCALTDDKPRPDWDALAAETEAQWSKTLNALSDDKEDTVQQRDKKIIDYIKMADNRLECEGCSQCVSVARSYLVEAFALLEGRAHRTLHEDAQGFHHVIDGERVQVCAD